VNFAAAGKGPAHSMIDDFLDSMAATTDQELGLVADIGLRAPDKGIQGIYPMDEACIDEKIEGAIHRHWRPSACSLREEGQDLVRTHRFMAVPDDGQHLAPDRRKAQVAFGTDTFRREQCGGLALPVIVGSVRGAAT
jgi:hypothetical protein